MAKREPDHTPLSDSSYYILIALVSPRHGYAVMLKVEEITEGEIRIGPATLYTTLTRLQESKLIEPRGDIPQNDERRKPYALTPRGVEALRLETRRREKIAADGRNALAQLEENNETHE